MKFIKFISTVILIAFLSSIIGISAFAKDLTIKDVQTTDETNDNIQWVVNQGYMSLTLEKFFPSKYVKRGEFAAIICKLTGSGTVLQDLKTSTFQDVTSKNQFFRQIETAKAYMTYFKSKTGKLFKPDSYITREDAMMSIVKVLGYDTDEALGSNDNTDISLDDLIDDAGSVDQSMVKYISVGISSELMDLREVGDKSYFDPKKNITRKDLAILIYNAYQKKDYTVEETVNNSNENADTSGIDPNTQNDIPSVDQNRNNNNTYFEDQPDKVNLNDPLGLRITDSVNITRTPDGYSLNIDKSKFPTSMNRLSYLCVTGSNKLSDDLIKLLSNVINYNMTPIWKYNNDYSNYSWEEDGSRYDIVLFYDNGMNLLGYYIFDKTTA